MGFNINSGNLGGSDKKVKIIIGRDGKVRWDMMGFKDASCKEVSAKLAQAFGGKIVTDDEKPEAYIPVEKESEQRKLFG